MNELELNVEMNKEEGQKIENELLETTTDKVSNIGTSK